jgi:hypothetical protein
MVRGFKETKRRDEARMCKDLQPQPALPSYYTEKQKLMDVMQKDGVDISVRAKRDAWVANVLKVHQTM